ncbi:MAG: hypothetical protein JSV44_05900 [Candidatus Zixiibacteriota bacterium]|nr:MAG: hypothetical protein JSV44_05900 [candidate division Zixibacteria bacterium]
MPEKIEGVFSARVDHAGGAVEVHAVGGALSAAELTAAVEKAEYEATLQAING